MRPFLLAPLAFALACSSPDALHPNPGPVDSVTPPLTGLELDWPRASGTGQEVEVTQPAQEPLAVLVRVDGLPTAGIPVRWISCCGSAMEPEVAITDIYGVAKSSFRAGTQAMTGQVVTATVADKSLDYQVNVLAGPVAALGKVTSVPDSVPVGANIQLTVVALDQYGNRAGSHPVLWRVTVTGEALALFSAQTSASGTSTLWVRPDAPGKQVDAFVQLDGTSIAPVTFHTKSF